MSQQDHEYDEVARNMVTNARRTAQDYQRAADEAAELADRIRDLGSRSVIDPTMREKEWPPLLNNLDLQQGTMERLEGLAELSVRLHARASIWSTYADQAAETYGVQVD